MEEITTPRAFSQYKGTNTCVIIFTNVHRYLFYHSLVKSEPHRCLRLQSVTNTVNDFFLVINPFGAEEHTPLLKYVTREKSQRQLSIQLRIVSRKHQFIQEDKQVSQKGNKILGGKAFTPLINFTQWKYTSLNLAMASGVILLS
ncbi:hypothetical protein TNIN_258641 [Trichonephila inaurata madagascariensis]|uniref:Uncharacterized protein n=1 Tax=Trichonephila inaurata madagascariensis TaxID=2747483 RepID=A0A8X7C725_9ARAC|nr:hypothetical protein TNIN_258641 [Trichonephila inaurata madagascariensis]